MSGGYHCSVSVLDSERFGLPAEMGMLAPVSSALIILGASSAVFGDLG